ncbi:MAG: T9SS type A sorting domain-containing protein, partial [Bacteroides sp.]|nr:T9SS type A sorting domain-containing protein [Bacteroides sp.]
GVDDYLHQAASSDWWPEGISYDPDNSGTVLESLGVHEHWNNDSEKLYSRNLGMEYGIELIKPFSTGITRGNILSGVISGYPNPFADQIHIKMSFQSVPQDDAVIQVFDLGGKLVLKHISKHMLNGKGEVTLDLVDQPTGNYVLQVDIGSERQSMIIQKQ